MSALKKIYIAGPDVFLPNAIEIGRIKKNLCADYGYEGIFPLDNEVAGGGYEIFCANRDLMNDCDLGLFNLTPFRGPSADVGTVFELGYMFALGKPVYGYSGSEILFTERSLAAFGRKDSHLKDRAGFAIENFGLHDNLMIDGAIRTSGGVIVTKDSTCENCPLAALDAFRLCLDRLQGQGD